MFTLVRPPVRAGSRPEGKAGTKRMEPLRSCNIMHVHAFMIWGLLEHSGLLCVFLLSCLPCQARFNRTGHWQPVPFLAPPRKRGTSAEEVSHGEPLCTLRRGQAARTGFATSCRTSKRCARCALRSRPQLLGTLSGTYKTQYAATNVPRLRGVILSWC